MPELTTTIAVGADLPTVRTQTSTTQVFRYSAATWNTHRIHYDHEYALAEGYPTVLVQSHLHGALLTKYCTDLAGSDGRLLELALSVRKYAVAGEELAISGVVTSIEEQPDGRAVVALELTETRGSDGEVCVPATAKIDVPVGRLAGEAQ
jgi:hydroxyacyl-ACP dehydratase HTD2-like protein with hotdog domain